tara:strand:+ start:466 stop:651 length:186 start_codon:yes stop_codon:yes gene_type:complete
VQRINSFVGTKLIKLITAALYVGDKSSNVSEEDGTKETEDGRRGLPLLTEVRPLKCKTDDR